MRSIVVTGGSGMIGSALCRHAAGMYEIDNLDITQGIDITDADQVERFISTSPSSTVIHLAAFVDVSAAHKQCEDRDGLCYRLNVVGTRNVARACLNSGKHLIHLSTDFVFDGESTEPYTEDSPTHPIEWYGATKRMAEEELFASDCSWTIVRIAFPYTHFPTPKMDLVRTFIATLQSKNKIRAFNDQVITPTWMDDVVQGLLLLAEHPQPRQIFHLVGSESLTPFDLAAKIARFFGFEEHLVEASSLEDYLKIDPRPRQRCLKISNEKWTRFAQAHGLDRPLAIDAALERMRTNLK